MVVFYSKHLSVCLDPPTAAIKEERFAMAFSNARVLIELGNVESRLVGPAPRQALDRALNPRWRGRSTDDIDEDLFGGYALVYSPGSDTFLTGALKHVKRVLKREGIRFRIRDLRWSRRREKRWSMQGHTLRPYQQEVLDRAVRAGRGLIDIGTGGGKTLLAAAIIVNLGLPTIYFVNTRTLLNQTVKSLEKLLGVEPGVVGQGVQKPRRLTVALIQSMTSPDTDLAMWRGGAMIFDEGHHAAAASYQDLIRRIEPRYAYYLSAVPFRSGLDQAILSGLAGKPLTGGRYSASFLIEKGYACKVAVRIEACPIHGEMTEKTFRTLYEEFIVRNESRNARIARVARTEIDEKRSVLVLVDRIRHGFELLNRIGDGAVFVRGATPRAELHETTASFADSKVPCLIATSGLFQEGVSIDNIHTLINAGGLKSKKKVIQSVGRGMRLAPGKKVCTYVDFWDDDEAGVFRNHSRQRLQTLKEEGFHVPDQAEKPLDDMDDEEIAPTWAHAQGTNRFYLIDGEGDFFARAICLNRDLVPEKLCKNCAENALCEKGKRIVWPEDLE